MTSINAGGAFYRVQNQLNQNSERVSQSMQRLASGQQNISPGDRTSSTAVAFGMKAESASLKVGMQNGTEALQSIEMVTNDLAQLNDIVVRLEEIHALGANGFNTAQDTSALTTEAANLLAEMSRITVDAKWKGNGIMGATAKANDMSFGRNTTNVDIKLPAFVIPEVALGFNTAGDSIYQKIDISTGTSAAGSTYALATTTPQAVAARTIDTKPSDKEAQSALAINGAVFFQHLTATHQATFQTVGTADENGISLSATALTVDDDRFHTVATVGANATMTLANTTNNVARQLVFHSVGNSSSAVFTISGTDANGLAITENLTAVAAGTPKNSALFYKTVTSITTGAVAATGNIKVGTATGKLDLSIGGALAAAGTATNAAARNVTIKSSADDSAKTFTVTGTDKNGNALTETITGSDGTGTGTATGSEFFKTITSVKSSAFTAGSLEIGIGTAIQGGPVELAGSDIGSGSAEAALALLTLKSSVDTMNITAGNLYNKVSNIMSHMGSLDAGYQLDFASKMDVNFAGETTELAKGQILAQAGTAMLAQANAQGQGMLALLQT